jgi:hypothetical protein
MHRLVVLQRVGIGDICAIGLLTRMYLVYVNFHASRSSQLIRLTRKEKSYSMPCYNAVQYYAPTPNAFIFFMGIIISIVQNSCCPSRTAYLNTPPVLFGVVDYLGIHVLWNLSRETHSYADDFLRMQRGHVAKDSVWTALSLACAYI